MKAAPRRWGYTLSGLCAFSSSAGCPTQVGIYRLFASIPANMNRLPHAGGDIPQFVVIIHCRRSAAPRRWGYTPELSNICQDDTGCPTQVGIYPSPRRQDLPPPRLPHAGGDIPVVSNTCFARIMAAPRRWGYTNMGRPLTGAPYGCPTQVGIYLRVVRPRS